MFCAKAAALVVRVCLFPSGSRRYPHVPRSNRAGEVAAGKPPAPQQAPSSCFTHTEREPLHLQLPRSSPCIRSIISLLPSAQQQRPRQQRSPAATAGLRDGRQGKRSAATNLHSSSFLISHHDLSAQRWWIEAFDSSKATPAAISMRFDGLTGRWQHMC